jgi:hypothetical protein
MPSFRERLGVPWWAWPATAAGSLFAVAEVTMGAPSLQVPLAYAAVVVLALGGLVLAGRIRVAVRDGELHVDDARLAVGVIDTVSVVTGEEKRRLLGLDAEPLAFVIQRPWIAGGVRVDLADPTDPTPYWFVSSRRPDELAAAILEAHAAAQSQPEVEPTSPSS